MMTTEVLHKKNKAEIVEAYNRFVKTMESIVPAKERRQALIDGARDILEFLTGSDSATKSKRSDNAQVSRLASSMTP